MTGFLVGSYGLTWALKNTSKILKLAILNSPLTVSSPVPGLFQKLRFSSYITYYIAPAFLFLLIHLNLSKVFEFCF
jgi:putative Mn2+ efflux pump MntP